MGNDSSTPATTTSASTSTSTTKPPMKAHETQTLNAIQVMNEKIQNITKRNAYLQKSIDNELAEAVKKKKRNDMKGALLHMKKKKMYENEIDKNNNALLTLENQRIALESATSTQTIVEAMKVGKDALTNIQSKINVESVENLKEEIEEAHAQAAEIDNVIMQPIGGMDLDDDELLKEMETMEAEEELEAMPAVKKPAAKSSTKAVDSLPAVPSHKVNIPQKAKAKKIDDDEAALRELEAELA